MIKDENSQSRAQLSSGSSFLNSALSPVKLICLFLLSLFLLSCETVSYYGQAAKGQLYILNHRSDIAELIDSNNTEPLLKAKLETILAIRAFAEDELMLPLEDNYSTYVDLQRAYVVWNVFAVPELSMSAVNWCYPIAGCVSYRGYFNEQQAREYASKLERKENYDVYVGGVAAYSTLGWFSDSVLSTIVGREDYQLASLIFHELAHQLLYIPGDTEFNESFATAVEQEGLRRWLLHTQENDEEAKQIVAKAEQERMRRDGFVELVTGTVLQLRQLYSSAVSAEDMLVEKQNLMAQLRSDYQQLKENWDNYGGYDAWFSQDLNNAQLSTVSTYFSWVPAFQQILQEEGSLQSFYERVAELERLSKVDRKAVLESYSVEL